VRAARVDAAWVVAGLYVVIGWTALAFVPVLWRELGVFTFSLIVGGGVAYSVGARVYSARRPDPMHAVFGFRTRRSIEQCRVQAVPAVGRRYVTEQNEGIDLEDGAVRRVVARADQLDPAEHRPVAEMRKAHRRVARGETRRAGIASELVRVVVRSTVNLHGSAHFTPLEVELRRGRG
jgi:hypothetical protein